MFNWMDERNKTKSKLGIPVVGVSFGERKAGCLGYETVDLGNGVDYECGYNTKIDCDECKFGGGRKNPEAKVNQN